MNRSRLTRRGRAVIVGAALGVSFAAGLTAQVWNPYTRGLECQTVTLGEDVDGTGWASRQASSLISAGWYGDPADHAERLYSPTCR